MMPDCPCSALDDALAACDDYRLRLGDLERDNDYLQEQVSRLKMHCGQSDLLTVYDVAAMMGTTIWAVYQRVARDKRFPRRVRRGYWDKNELELYFTERGETPSPGPPCRSDSLCTP